MVHTSAARNQRAKKLPNLNIKQRDAGNESLGPTIEPALARILGARGIKSVAELDYSLRNLLPPSGLSHIEEAAELLAEAIFAQANVVIVGDFDADGATSCALAVRCLKKMGLQDVSYIVPNRFEFGYGLSPEIVGAAAVRQPDIIVTVDNGISSVDGVHVAQQLGISVLVTDHHLPGEELPTADVIVNPNLPGDRFASKNLAGVGVIFYVMLALRARLRRQGWFQQASIDEPNMSQFLDLVALGTVADVVPLDRNNRILVHQGLERIRQQECNAGIRALLTVAKKNFSQITATDLGFAVGPRLNAAGRLDDMSVGIECLLCDDFDQALGMARELDELNQARRVVESDMQQEAAAIVDSLDLHDGDPQIYVLFHPDWHQGVVGLVASRIKERTHRPVLAFAPSAADEPAEGQDGDDLKAMELKGSARSIEGVHIRDVLAHVDATNPGLIDKFGGHAMAAGLSLDSNKLEKFKSAITASMRIISAGTDLTQTLWTDGVLSDEEFGIDFAHKLRTLSPWGQGFPVPNFEGYFKVLQARYVGDIHAKMTVQCCHTNTTLEAICFSWGALNAELPAGEVRMVYELDVNEWRDRQSVQLLVKHIE